MRTVILLKGENLTEVSVYEEETCLFAPKNYYWQVNDRGNFEGFENNTGAHRFTWQPHGSQFTIVSDVPEKRLKLRIKRPKRVSPSAVLKDVGFDPSWIEIVE